MPNGGVLVAYDSDLLSLSGLEALTSILYDLEIVYDDDLSSMDSLYGLTGVQNILIEEDPSLAIADAEALVAENDDVRGGVFIIAATP